MMHSGPPWHHEKPEGDQPPQIPAPEVNSGNLEILTKVRLGIPHGDNYARELILIVYRPFAANETKWQYAFALGAGANEPVRYAIGADFIEALLDTLALVRVTYEAMIPAKWQPPEFSDFDSVQFWPHKIGRNYFTEPAKQTFPDMPDFRPSWLRDGTCREAEPAVTPRTLALPTIRVLRPTKPADPSGPIGTKVIYTRPFGVTEPSNVRCVRRESRLSFGISSPALYITTDVAPQSEFLFVILSLMIQNGLAQEKRSTAVCHLT